jgi:hypothetical protein
MCVLQQNHSKWWIEGKEKSAIKDESLARLNKGFRAFTCRPSNFQLAELFTTSPHFHQHNHVSSHLLDPNHPISASSSHLSHVGHRAAEINDGLLASKRKQRGDDKRIDQY